MFYENGHQRENFKKNWVPKYYEQFTATFYYTFNIKWKQLNTSKSFMMYCPIVSHPVGHSSVTTTNIDCVSKTNCQWKVLPPIMARICSSRVQQLSPYWKAFRRKSCNQRKNGPTIFIQQPTRSCRKKVWGTLHHVVESAPWYEGWLSFQVLNRPHWFSVATKK